MCRRALGHAVRLLFFVVWSLLGRVPCFFFHPIAPPGRVPNAGSFISLARWAALRLRGHYLSGALGYEGAQVAAWRGQPVQPLSVLSLSRHRHSWPKRLAIIGGVCARVLATGGGSQYKVCRQGRGIVLYSWRKEGLCYGVYHNIFHGSDRCGKCINRCSNSGLGKAWPADNRLLIGLPLPAYSLEPLR